MYAIRSYYGHVKFHIVPATDEVVSENNTREAELTVQDRRQRILYFEGEPRFEVKFIRRALAKDDNIRIVSLIRTAESKFYRLGIDTPQELATGFPQRPRITSYNVCYTKLLRVSHCGSR